MDVLTVVLRLVHILSGVFWVGGILFVTLLLSRTLRTLGPQVQGPVMRHLAMRMGAAFGTAGLLVLISGLWLIQRTLGSLSPGRLLATDWGVSIFAGLVAVVVMLAIGFGVNMRTSLQMERLLRAAEEAASPPPLDELRRLGGRIARASWLLSALGVLAVASMAVARYV